MKPYPMKFVPVYKEKVWGGRTLEQLGRELPGESDAQIGESWELVDLATTSVSGGGGGSERSVIANGELAGKTLAEAIDAMGAGVMGDLPLSDDGGFPILLKYLDANENLSVQVHPSPEYAATHDDAFLKSESWYIVDRRPGATIYKGIHEGVTPEQMRAALEANTDAAVVPLMIEVPVEPGDCHYLPSGTCHALGGGILVAEVQTPSDTTFRVYDWGRTGRELHVEQAIACIDFGPVDTGDIEKRVIREGEGVKMTRLVNCEHFVLEKVEAEAGFGDEVSPAQPMAWMVVAGGLTLGDLELVAGDTLLLPAGMDAAAVSVGEAGASWLEVRFPKAESGALA
ncbi:MAG: type I phosphomannose isomerase catalytic subunit [Planctomycetota bacterium]